MYHDLASYEYHRLPTENSVTVKYIVIIDHNYRAWQRKLFGLVQDGNNREELYKCLHMLLTTSEENTFSDLLSKFVVCWRSKEPSFVEYFETSYAGRPGTYMNTCIDDFSMIILLLKKNGLCAIDILVITVWIQTCLLRGKIKHFIILHICNACILSVFTTNSKTIPERRLDDLLHVLFKFESDVYIARKTKEVTN